MTSLRPPSPDRVPRRRRRCRLHRRSARPRRTRRVQDDGDDAVADVAPPRHAAADEDPQPRRRCCAARCPRLRRLQPRRSSPRCREPMSTPHLRPGHPAQTSRRFAGRTVLGDDQRPQRPCCARRSQLAKVEARDEVRRAGKAAAMLGAAGLAGWLALIMLSFALAWLLDQALNTALSFAIVGVALGDRRRRLADDRETPAETSETLPQTKETTQGGRRMGQSADELRRDIEQTRDGLCDTLDAIGDRVSPGRVLERRKNRAVQGIQSLRDRVMGSVSDAKDGISDGDRQRRRHDQGRPRRRASPDPGQPPRRRGHRLRRRLPDRRRLPAEPARAAGRPEPDRQGRAGEGRARSPPAATSPAVKGPPRTPSKRSRTRPPTASKPSPTPSTTASKRPKRPHKPPPGHQDATN